MYGYMYEYCLDICTVIMCSQLAISLYVFPYDIVPTYSLSICKITMIGYPEFNPPSLSMLPIYVYWLYMYTYLSVYMVSSSSSPQFDPPLLALYIYCQYICVCIYLSLYVCSIPLSPPLCCRSFTTTTICSLLDHKCLIMFVAQQQ